MFVSRSCTNNIVQSCRLYIVKIMHVIQIPHVDVAAVDGLQVTLIILTNQWNAISIEQYRTLERMCAPLALLKPSSVTNILLLFTSFCHGVRHLCLVMGFTLIVLR